MEEKINQNIGFLLRKLRKDKILKKKDILKTLNISAQQLNKYENGVNRISAAKLYLLLNKYNIDYTIFFNKKDNILQKLIVSYDKITDQEIKNNLLNLIESIACYCNK